MAEANGRDRRKLWFALWFVLGVALVIGYAWRTLSNPPAPEPVAAIVTPDAPVTPGAAPAGVPEVAPIEHPLLEITIEGEANGRVVVELFPELAPEHVRRLVTLADRGAYDGVVFHRVIDGFMAQTGDVQFGRIGEDMSRAGTGASDLPDLPAEFSNYPYGTGVVGMARGTGVNTANSQFFITFAPAEFLNGKYTVVGKVVEGMDVVEAIKRGTGNNGAVIGKPDVMTRVRVLDGG
ncbi:MAG TPA: peptidylprolyl isomerase [Aliiroseovarius sp.]|nr:peptidylprolyl isomerase [Aliiroseovarius sp.]